MVAVCGRTTLTPEQQQESGFRQVYPLTALESKVEICIAEAGPCLNNWESTSAVELADPTPAAPCQHKGAPECLKNSFDLVIRGQRILTTAGIARA